jgi:DUF438 domain-containing protein
MENIKLTEDELQKIKDLREQFGIITTNVGVTEVQIMELNTYKEGLKVKVAELRKQEQEIYEELSAKYGNGTISLESGEFIKN